MTDRQEQKPLKKVQPISTHSLQLVDNLSFSLERVVNVQKKQYVSGNKYHANQQDESIDDESIEKDDDEFKEEEIYPKGDQEENEKYQNNDIMISNDVEERVESQYCQQKIDKSQDKLDQTQNKPSHLAQQQQQQVFIPSTPPKIQPQQNDPITKKQIYHPQPTPVILQQYNNIKYTYNEMQDQQIALSSSGLIVSQQNVVGSEEIVVGKKLQGKERGEENVEMGEEMEQKVTSLEDIRLGENLDKTKDKKTMIENTKNDKVQKGEADQDKNDIEKQEQTENQQHQQQQNHSMEIQNQQINLSNSQANIPNSKSQSNNHSANSNKSEQQPSQIPLSKNPTQQKQQPSHLSQHQSQSQQSPSHFSVQRYKSIQPILQQLLTELKSILKHVKSDTSSNFMNKNKPSNSKFFNNNKNSRSASRHKQYNNPNNSLQDIMERRRQNLLFSSNKGQDVKDKNNISYQHIGREKDKVYVGVEGTKNKAVPYGLGNFGNVSHFDIMRHPHQAPEQIIPNDLSRLQDQQRQKLIINRQKINEILASSVSNFKKPEPVKNKFKSTSYFNHRNQPFYKEQKGQAQKNQDVSFVADSQNSHNQLQMPRKIIRSTNFSKLANKQPQSIQEIPSLSTHKNTIQQQKHQKAFFLQKPLNSQQYPLPNSITPLLKIIKKYLQVIAEGKIDDIETFLNTTGEGLVACNNLNQLINRKKLFKTAMYFERASIVAGICYGYLMITEQRGYLSYQVQQIALINRTSKGEQVSKQSIQSLKQHIKQILKYMINLASFCLNNCKLIIKTIQDYLIKPSVQSLTSQQQSKTKTKHSSHQLIEKQIYKRNIETIKLNIQYTQETLAKLFSQTLGMAQKLAIDQDFGESFKNVTKLIQKHTIQESFYTLLEYFSFYLCLIKRQRSIPFLAVAPNPYLDTPDKYTLVIDFVSVFCYGTKKSKTFIFRPYSQHFLNQMAQYFDIVAVCDALPQQIDKIIDLLDTKGVIKHRLYKYHMVEEKITGRYTKSLERIGRDMDKVILLDVQNNQVTQECKNTIFISEWKGSKNDSVLAELCSVLLSIVVNRLDCRRAAQRIHEQMKINIANGIRHINFGLNLKQDLLRQSDNMKIVGENVEDMEKE